MIVVYDACVLYPAPLRDFLLRLALTGLYEVRWSALIHEEWMRNVLVNRPDLTKAQLVRTRALMERALPEALVSDFEILIGQLELPDPDDHHVLAVAIHSSAEVIVTFNLSDFPTSALTPYGIEAQHPDDFVLRYWDKNKAQVITAAQQQRQALQKPRKSVPEFLEVLAMQSLVKTVALLEEHREKL